MNFDFRHATHRNTKAYRVFLGDAVIYISYETPVGLQGYIGSTWYGVRRENAWGPTTGRHMKEMGIHHYQEVGEAEFEEMLEQMVTQAALREITNRLDEPLKEAA